MSGEPLANGRREIYTLDVGQADAHAIITEDGTLNLIDADEAAVGDELDTVLAGRSTPETESEHIPIETFVLTHIHDDHAGGVEELYDHGYEIQNVVEPDAHRYKLCDSDTEKSEKGVSPLVWETYDRQLEEHDPETIRQVSGGDLLTPDSDIQVLAPPDEPETVSFTSPVTGRKNTLKPTGANANSLAFKTEDEQSMLFMGDVEDTGGLNGESWLMSQHDNEQSDVNLDADVLVLSHHGSNNATSEEFLDRVDPEAALVSSGLHNKHTSENPHDAHPHDATLKHLHDQDVDVYWTVGHGTLRTELDSNGVRPEPTTDFDTTDAADLAALKYYCREHDVSPERIAALTPDHLPEDTPEWAADAAPMLVETTEEIVDEAITDAETVEDLRQTLTPTPDAHDQLHETVQADREEHVTTKADVRRNKEAYFDAVERERDYERLPLHTRLRANLPKRFGGIEHPLTDVPSPEEIDGPRKVEEVSRAVQHQPAAKQRAKGEIVIDTQLREAEEATDTAVNDAHTRDTLCQHLRATPGAHQDFLYAIETPDAHNANKSEKDLSDLLAQTNETQPERSTDRTHKQDSSIGL
ncbi:ComEC/Rec2 family competence protein [Halocatena salina]|uniref:Metallo-beta-lactamase domain-containing protein n=1 Tax=Halocatena salina TaxID=2934340 RepID=A0A8T9ZYX8_9EURY|nr:MBL fold metallo-hydrolase [Halocatena salina]UPM41646.1 hypothetical protein MW046_06495 [Halocatena salina]